MTFQLRVIHLFNHGGDRRSLDFKLNALNIITGRSRSGKSSIIEIIDYCLGSRGYHVAAGVIRDTVACFALELETSDGVVLVGRKAPANGRATTSTLHVSFRANNAGRPELAELESNSDLSSAIEFLSRLLGIDDNVTDIGEGTRSEFNVTIRHALFFNFQSQDEIANQDVLFHSQNEEFIPQAIRDSLPYFLGAVDPYYVLKREQLRIRERELKGLLRTRNDEQAISRSTGRALSLLSEAIGVGLANPADDTSSTYVLSALAGALAADSQDVIPVVRSNELAELLDARNNLRLEFTEQKAILRKLNAKLRYEDDFTGEAGEQRSRLQSLELLGIETNSYQEHRQCPICNSVLLEPVTAVLDILDHLGRVSREISDVGEERQHLQGALSIAESAVSDLNAALFTNQQSIDRASESLEALDSLRETSMQRAAVRGRISLFLDSVSLENESAFLEERIASLEQVIDQLKADLDSDAAATRLTGALARVSYRMAQIASELKLEHSPSPVRLDMRNLTVVVDTPKGSYQLSQIGSGENWLGYHIAALAALHGLFAEDDRPVPRFLVVDQPSQVYFPVDRHDNDVLNDDDMTALGNAYEALNTLASTTEGGFQVIVLDHADLPNPFFQEAVVEKWRGDGEALIPESWIVEPGSSNAE